MEKEKVTEELVRQNGNQAAAVMADFAGGGGGGSVPKFSDFVILEPLTPEEIELWAAANAGTESTIQGGYKLNKKVLERLLYFDLVDEIWKRKAVDEIREHDDAGNILAIGTGGDIYEAKNSLEWGINVPDSVSDDYFYHISVAGPR